tara:strand:+ start:90 stop:263 length:174 start_codon:yes stop_codon:yes gene_type:complete
MSSTFQVDQTKIKIESLLQNYKTVSEKTAFLEGFQACLENEKVFIENEKRKMESENE